LELVAERSTDSQGTGDAKRKSTAEAFEERIRLRTSGDVYHPKLLSYGAVLGLGLTQQSLSSDIESGSGSGCLNEYSLSAQLLQAKPYPMAFYTNRSEELMPRQFLGALATESTSSGGSLAIRSEDWPMQFQYSTSEMRQDSLAPEARDSLDRDEERFTYSVDHDLSRLSHVRFEFNKNDISHRSSLGTSTTIKDDRYTLLHDSVFGSEEQHRIDSFFDFLDQSGTSDLEQTRWDERLKLRHTPNFLTHYNFRLTESRRELSKSDQIRGQAGFEHRLYESLVTTGHVFSSESDLGNDADRTERGGLLAFDYQKNNPWGRLESRYVIGLTRLEQSGGTGTGIVIDEQHVFIDPLPIILDKVNIDTSSIVVTDSTGTIVYAENADYIVTEISGRVQLEINPFGPGGITDGQTLLVDYNFFTEPERKEDTLDQIFSVAQRFDNGLSLYYSRSQQDQDVRSSLTEITPDEFTVDTYGAAYFKNGLSLLAEFTDRDSTRVPSTTKRLKARYNWVVNRDTRASVWASNDWRDFGRPDDRDTRVFRSGSELSTRLTDRTDISASMAYRDESDSRFGSTKGLQLNSELSYVRRQLELSAGVRYGELDRRNDQSENTFLYVRMTRRF
jgi:hypothetical protein